MDERSHALIGKPEKVYPISKKAEATLKNQINANKATQQKM